MFCKKYRITKPFYTKLTKDHHSRLWWSKWLKNKYFFRIFKNERPDDYRWRVKARLHPSSWKLFPPVPKNCNTFHGSLPVHVDSHTKQGGGFDVIVLNGSNHEEQLWRGSTGQELCHILCVCVAKSRAGLLVSRAHRKCSSWKRNRNGGKLHARDRKWIYGCVSAPRHSTMKWKFQDGTKRGCLGTEWNVGTVMSRSTVAWH